MLTGGGSYVDTVPEHEAFAEAVARELAPLLSDHGFRLVSDSDYLVRFESETLGAEADFDPRGEVVVGVFAWAERLRGSGGRTAGWSAEHRFRGSWRSRANG